MGVIATFSKCYDCTSDSDFIQQDMEKFDQIKVITDPYPDLKGGLVKVRAWMSNYIIYKIIYVITYPCANLS